MMRRFFRLPSSEQTVARDIDDEISFHIEARVADLIAAGRSPAEARRWAEQEFGDVADARTELESIDLETVRRSRRATWRDALLQDLRTAVRGMRRSPLSTLAIVVTLALGIGVNAAMFAVTDRLLLSAPPHIEDADQLVRVLYEHTGPFGRPTTASVFPYPDYDALRSTSAFAEVGAFAVTRSVLGRGASSRELRLGQATATFFPMLRVEPEIGRFFSVAEDAPPRGERVVVLSHALWQSAFAGSVDVLGSTIEIDHTGYQVIGVAPRGFNGIDLEGVDLWVPVSALGHTWASTNWHMSRGAHYLRMVARLRDGVATSAAREQATAAFLAVNEERFAGDTGAGVVLGSIIAARTPELDDGAAQRGGRIALLLFGVSLLVVLIACVNVINLLLARGMRQQRETGIRVALGISRSRLAALTLIETLMPAIIGGALGLVCAYWTGQLASAMLLPDLDWNMALMSWRVLGFTAAIALVCSFVASIAPALHAVRSPVSELLGHAARTTYRRSVIRSGLMAFQPALSVLLLVGAGLFLRSLREAGHIPLGYEPARVAAFTWHTNGLDWSRERTLALYDAALERAAALPAVESAALTMSQPLWTALFGGMYVPGVDSIPVTQDIIYSAVSPDYFRTVGARMMQGRAFTAADVTGSPPVAVVTEALARAVWPGESAIGRCFMTYRGEDAPCREVIGVVEDTRYTEVLDEPTLMYYLPLAQEPGRGSMRALFVRLRGDVDTGIDAVRGALQTIEPGLPHIRATLLEERVEPALRPWRLGAVMFTSFGVLALVLASLGLYGVVAYDVAQRRRELGVRFALGARAGDVLRMVIGEGVRVVVVGLVVGTVLSIVAARRFEHLLFNTSARDPAVHSAVVLLLLVVAAIAAAVPALRASRIEPTEALRDD